jgi:hypothetical protein
MRFMLFRIGLLAIPLALAFGCEDDSGAYDEIASWPCFEDSETCSCFGVDDPSSVDDSRDQVVSCRPELDCCFVIDRGPEGYECVCVSAAELVVTSEAGAGGAGGEGNAAGTGGESLGGAHGTSDPELLCAAAALERGSTEVVGHCPPVTLDDASVCAFQGESCDRDYLEEHGLIACCDGHRCGKDAFGGNVCVPN